MCFLLVKRLPWSHEAPGWIPRRFCWNDRNLLTFPNQHGAFDMTRWFQIVFIFTPDPWGNDPIWLYHIFQIGWNHQPVSICHDFFSDWRLWSRWYPTMWRYAISKKNHNINFHKTSFSQENFVFGIEAFLFLFSTCTPPRKKEMWQLTGGLGRKPFHHLRPKTKESKWMCPSSMWPSPRRADATHGIRLVKRHRDGVCTSGGGAPERYSG